MRTTSAVAFWTAACIGAPAMGQVPAINPTAIDEILVVGARAPVPVGRLGSATTVITRSDLESRQALYVTDVLRSVPGFSVSHSGGIGSQTQVRVRGSEANHVLVLIDGVRANDPATSDEFRWEHLTARNVERIEIVRGPQSALWGTDAIGAVVNIVSRGGADAAGLDSYAETGSDNAVNIGVSGNGSVDQWTFGAGLESLATDGGNISRTGTERDGSELAMVNLNARYDDGRRWRLDATLRATDATSDFDAVDGFVTGLPIDADLATDSDSVVGSFGASFSTPGGATWQARASYFDSEHRNFTDGVQESTAASDRIAYVVQTTLPFERDRLTLALEHENTEFAQRGAVVFGDPNQDQDMQITSLTGEYQRLASDRLTWILSSRLDTNSDFEDAVTGRLAMSYDWSASTQLRGSIGTGQKTPTFTELFGFFPEQFIGNPDLKPERSKAVDIGIEKRFLDGALSVDATLFRQTLEDEINGFVFDPVTFLATAENRRSQSERSGIEVAASWRIDERASLHASYTYTDAHEDDDLGHALREIRRPENAGSLALDFGTRSGRVHATLAADYGGSRLDQFFPPYPEPQQFVTLESFWLVDLTVQLRIADSVTIFARGTNLLDERYEQVFGYRTLGRAGYVGIRTTFGRTR